MDIDWVLGLVAAHGYLALFLSLFLGVAGLPINDETLVIMAGFVAASGLLEPIPAFLVTYAGVLCGMNVGFLAGRLLGSGALRWLGRRGRVQRQIERARAWLDRYGPAGIVLSYYVPGVRHLVPYLVGIGQMGYLRFGAVAFSGGLLWTAIFFAAGYLLGDNWRRAADLAEQVGLYAGVLLVVVLTPVLVWAIRRGRRMP